MSYVTTTALSNAEYLQVVEIPLALIATLLSSQNFWISSISASATFLSFPGGRICLRLAI